MLLSRNGTKTGRYMILAYDVMQSVRCSGAWHRNHLILPHTYFLFEALFDAKCSLFFLSTKKVAQCQERIVNLDGSEIREGGEKNVILNFHVPPPPPYQL